MSDPFDVLRTESPPAAPDVAAIKGRARRIQQRQRMVVGGSAVSVAVVAIIAIVVSSGPVRRPANLAQTENRQTRTDAESGAVSGGTSASTGAAAEGYEDTTADDVAAPQAPEGQERSLESGGAAAAGSPPDGTMPFNLSATVSAKPAAANETAFTLKVCNVYEDEHVRSFPNAQRNDFEVLRGDEKVWTWSDGQTFAQAVGEERWGPKECRTWTDTWDGMAESGPAVTGEFTVVGLLVGEPELRTDPVKFCRGLC